MTAQGASRLRTKMKIAVAIPPGRSALELQVEGRGGEQAHAVRDDAQSNLLPPNDSALVETSPASLPFSRRHCRRVQDEVSCCDRRHGGKANCASQARARHMAAKSTKLAGLEIGQHENWPHWR